MVSRLAEKPRPNHHVTALGLPLSTITITITIHHPPSRIRWQVRGVRQHHLNNAAPTHHTSYMPVLHIAHVTTPISHRLATKSRRSRHLATPVTVILPPSPPFMSSCNDPSIIKLYSFEAANRHSVVVSFPYESKAKLHSFCLLINIRAEYPRVSSVSTLLLLGHHLAHARNMYAHHLWDNLDASWLNKHSHSLCNHLGIFSLSQASPLSQEKVSNPVSQRSGPVYVVQPEVIVLRCCQVP